MTKEERIRELYDKARSNPASLRFREVCRLAEGVGFRLDRVRASHHIFLHPTLRELLNLQSRGGQAIPYQVRQLVKLIEIHGLLL